MGIYVLLIKDYEDSERVVYKYGPNEYSTGTIEYNKITMKFVQLSNIGRTYISEEFFLRVAVQNLAVIASKGNGNFPDKKTIET